MDSRSRGRNRPRWIAAGTGWCYLGSVTVETIFTQALGLPEEARAELAAKLLESLQEVPTEKRTYRAAWDAEIAERIEELEAGKAELIPWETARAQIFGR